MMPKRLGGCNVVDAFARRLLCDTVGQLKEDISYIVGKVASDR
jgi:hypothetical protein